MATTNRDVTIYGRLSFAHLFTPQAPNDQAEPKYSATILIPKTDTETIQRIQAAIQAAVTDAVDRRTFKQPIDPAHTKYPPLRDGDSLTDSGEARGPEFAGHYFIAAKASTKRKPFVVDGALQPIIDESEIYSGAYCNFAIQFYGYENSGNKGISASLIGVQKAKDGERLGGPALEATDVFSTLGGQAPPAAGNLGF
ncbi:DUF2815 family protein [Corynebacterium callunae]|uniref:DUF2815 family protein n=1 Tax=Corynebacterium callunae DSM 20147 TaxID=1121353 RepID=M1TRH8_9CORY|nr:DUF2815 family protein [Corynebacterium callunae]AGG66896.1 hypothetical protein H924_07270 [Corynebacterium callunae DSM 20147]